MGNASDAAIAVTRFGLGARPGEISAAAADPRAWLKRQIRREGADQPQGPDGPLPSIRESFAVFADYRQTVAGLRRTPVSAGPTDPSMAMAPAADPMAARRMAARPLRQDVAAEMLARMRLAAQTPAGFRERWALFWSNHFTVAAKAIQVSAAVGPFEREALRPRVFGRFQDLLVASSSHPGMLMYLDQPRSAGPDSPAGRRRKMGLNENLAREILELHTVGADAGYTQADVTEFARALTGWSMGAAGSGPQEGAYLYRAAMHEPGARTVMGRRYAEGGDDQALRILADLAAHPATARHIAGRIAAHFVADQPPAALVGRLEAAWRGSNGDLAVVAAALVDAPEAWAPDALKLKTPYEFLVSGYRAADAAPAVVAQDVVQPLTVMGQRPWSAPQPNGWSDQAGDWAAPDAMVKRLTWARSFSDRYAPEGDPAAVAAQALGARLTPAALTAIGRAESRTDAFALLLMSPEFQRR